MRFAVLATFSAPVFFLSLSSQISRANTVLTELRVADSIVIMPRRDPRRCTRSRAASTGCWPVMMSRCSDWEAFPPRAR